MERIIFILIIIALFIYIIKIKLEIKDIKSQMIKWNGQYINLRTRAIGTDLESLVKEINNLYDENQKIKVKNERIDEKLKRNISNISHDLRTPLTSISGYIQLLKEEDLSEDEEREYLNIVGRRVKSLQDLITSFYELSRLESNDYRFNLKNVNIKNILIDNIATYYADFDKNNIEPIIQIDKNVENIISDDIAINRVFSNLIGNMIKHGSGEVKIILKNEKNSIVTEFINSAPNLNKEDENKIFDRFYIKDKSRSSKSTGLGLSITKAFVEELGNKIECCIYEGKLKIKIEWNKK